MTKEHPLNKAFDELHKVLKKLEKHANDPMPQYVDPEVLKMLDKVSEEVDQFEKETIEMRDSLGLNERDIQKKLHSPPPETPEQTRDLMTRSLKAMNEVDKLKDQYNTPNPKGETPMSLLNKKKGDSAEARKAQKARASKFRRMGGNKDWRPM